MAGPVRADGVADVVRSADAMLEAAEQVTRAYEKVIHPELGPVVNVAGRQRMLSQRAARAYFMLANGRPSPTCANSLMWPARLCRRPHVLAGIRRPPPASAMNWSWLRAMGVFDQPRKTTRHGKPANHRHHQRACMKSWTT